MRRLLTALLLLSMLGLGASCGGGGGGDAPPCTKPGTLRTLAVQGQPAPGTAGAYGAFNVGLPMDCAPGGWSAFVVGTTDATRTQALFVAQPDGSVLLAWHVGEAVPAGLPGGGTITSLQALRINGSGQLVALATLTGNTNSVAYALLAATVSGGAVGAKGVVLLDRQDTTSSGSSGLVAAIDTSRLWLLADGRVCVGGTTSDLTEAVWLVNLDGSALQSLVATGDSLPD
ncbi:MAG: hypothetical protein ACKOSS_09415, partial [Planctomycetia bacterium]